MVLKEFRQLLEIEGVKNSTAETLRFDEGAEGLCRIEVGRDEGGGL